MQNIISNNEIKKIFIPKNDNYIFLSFDYSQIELRILAEFSRDDNLMESFLSNKDIHSDVAKKIFSINNDNENHEQRRIAKGVNFGIIYGITEYGLSQIINKPILECKNIIDKYFEIHKKVKLYIDTEIEKFKKNEYVGNIFNRRRNIPDINNKNKIEKEAAYRAVINMPIQSTAADILKLSMINIQKEFTKQKLKSKIVLQIHDELIIETHKNEIEIIKKIVSYLMINIDFISDWKIKLDVNIKKGINLFEL